MQAPSGQQTAPAMRALLTGGVLAGEWVLDPGTSSIRLKSKVIWGLIPVHGVFHEVSGSGTISPDGQVSGTITVAAASVDTKNPKRDNHLRSADFFDSGNHPDITFTTDGIRPSGHGVEAASVEAASVEAASVEAASVEVTGTLTVRGRTRPLSFTAAADVQGDGTAWLDAEVHINRADFGLTWNQLGMISMHNTLTIHAVFTRR